PSTSSDRSIRPPIDVHHLQLPDLDPLETPDIDRRHRRPRRMLPEPERRRPAHRAEVMLDAMLVERICRELRLAALEPQLLPRHEPQQIALAAAVRAIAVDHLLDLALDLVRNLPAMTASRIRHRRAPGPLRRPTPSPPRQSLCPAG